MCVYVVRTCVQVSARLIHKSLRVFCSRERLEREERDVGNEQAKKSEPEQNIHSKAAPLFPMVNTPELGWNVCSDLCMELRAFGQAHEIIGTAWNFRLDAILCSTSRDFSLLLSLRIDELYLLSTCGQLAMLQHALILPNPVSSCPVVLVPWNELRRMQEKINGSFSK